MAVSSSVFIPRKCIECACVWVYVATYHDILVKFVEAQDLMQAVCLSGKRSRKTR